MKSYLSQANATSLYLVVAGILSFVVFMCVFFIIKSYRAGLKMNMDKSILRKSIISSATFTAIPSIAILLGVIALAGNLGVPVSWLRLSVVGNLPYETLVAQIASEGVGASLDAKVLNMDYVVTIFFVMTVGILLGCILTVFFLEAYLKGLARKPKNKEGEKSEEKKDKFVNWALVAMFIALCATFLGSYLAKSINANMKSELSFDERFKPFIPIFTASVAAGVMKLNLFLVKKKGFSQLESFSLALSMIVAMATAVILGRF